MTRLAGAWVTTKSRSPSWRSAELAFAAYLLNSAPPSAGLPWCPALPLFRVPKTDPKNPTLPVPPLPRGSQSRAWWRAPASPTALAWSIASAARAHEGPLLVVARDNHEAHQLEADLHTLLGTAGDLPVVAFPDWETLPYDQFSPHPDIVSQRLSALHRLPTLEKGIVVDVQGRTSVPGVLAVGDAVQISDGATGLPLLPLIGTLAMRQALVAAATVVGMPWALPPATVWGLSEIFGLHWGSVGWSVEAATRAGLPVVALTQPVRTRDPFMPEGREGIWKLTVAAAEEKGLRRGQILGFQVVQEGDSPLFLAERFIDIITRRETVPELFGHYFIHSPAHNAVDDPYLNLIFQAQALLQ